MLSCESIFKKLKNGENKEAFDEACAGLMSNPRATCSAVVLSILFVWLLASHRHAPSDVDMQRYQHAFSLQNKRAEHEEAEHPVEPVPTGSDEAAGASAKLISMYKHFHTTQAQALRD